MFLSKQGFTLLELLIVVSVIGLLASTIFVSYGSYQEKARLSNAMQWASGVKSAMGFYANVLLRMDSEAGGVVFDDSGNGRNGELKNGASIISDGLIGGALNLDGHNDWMQITGDVGINGAMTIEFWFKTPNKNVNDYLFDNRSPGTWWFIKNYTGGLCGSVPGNLCFEGRVMAQDSDWHVDEWTHVAVSDDTSTARMYINGELVDTGPGQNTIISTNLRIGTRYTNTGYLKGQIDDVAVYPVALENIVIKQHYAQGLKKYRNLARIEE